MRLDARTGDQGWNVFDVPTAKQLKHVVWVDSTLSLWGELEVPFVLESGAPRIRMHSAKRIDILPPIRLVLIDPIDDDGAETVQRALDVIGSAA